MLLHVEARLRSWKEIFWKKAFAILAVLWGLVGVWDLVKSEFLPDKYQSLTVVKMTPHMQWRTWLIGILILLVFVLLEGAHTAIQRRDAEISRLGRGPESLSEHDPKVYLDPLNDEFTKTGMLPFEISNRGQRVNMAHAITIEPIELVPNVSFEYVDHLDMAERKKLFPKIEGHFLSAGNIVSELARAWDKNGQLEAMELPFEVKIKYEDAARTKKFESVITMIYSVIEEQNARRGIGKNVTPREYKIIRVSDTRIRRLA